MPDRREVKLFLVATICVASTGASALAALPGSIFTTTVDGQYVNANVQYESREDVYLDGGPGPNAPASAAGLADGDYYFQVTDPSGKNLLSLDHISCRTLHVNEYGVVDSAYAGNDFVKRRGKIAAIDCLHATGIDTDQSSLGAITVQLFPYDATPNRGGVYKVWITPVEAYLCTVDAPDQKEPVNGEGCSRFHGFDPAHSKTDTFKVRERGNGPPFVSPTLEIRKFHDSNLDGVEDSPDEEEILGWQVTVEDPIGVTNTEFTPAVVDASLVGTYIVQESTPSGTLQTVGILDDSVVTQLPMADPNVFVVVSGDSEEAHSVVFGNVGAGEIIACKVLDVDGDGDVDPGEPRIPGWQFRLEGTDAGGFTVAAQVQASGTDGCTTFGDLLPGDYTVTELLPISPSWQQTGSLTQDVTITSTLLSLPDGPILQGSSETLQFTNVCFDFAGFGTKGYWHNKNGLAEITQDDIAYVNMLAPYAAPSSYFEAGDEPFDEPLYAALEEISLFLIDSNAGGDPREQLAQQLLAFIFNARNRLGSLTAILLLPDGTSLSASDLIAAAISAWESGSASERNAIKDTLDALNNNDAVPFSAGGACEIVYGS